MLESAVGTTQDPRVRPRANLFQMIQWFKTQTTNEYIKCVLKKGWPRFNERFWQRGYYEHIIRNEDELAETRAYIINNPKMNHDEET
ncbi:MAG: transposase [Candidatus Riflebacteria bacterium]